MLYVQLDANWPDNHKIIEAGLDGAGLHATILCIAKRQEADGWVRRTLLERRYGASPELIDRLVHLTLLDAVDDMVRPHDWHDRNLSQAAIEAKKRARGRAGREGNHTRWNHPGRVEDCDVCNADGQVVAGCDPMRSDSDPNSSPKSKGTGAIAGAIADPDPGAYLRSVDETSDLMAGWEQVRAQTGRARRSA